MIRSVIIAAWSIAFFVASGVGMEVAADEMKKEITDIQNLYHTFYTIQTGSFIKIERAQKQFDFIAQRLEEKELDYLRIEKIGKFYSIRLGKFEDPFNAEKYLQTIKPHLPTAIRLKAYIKDERIIKLYKKSSSKEDVITGSLSDLADINEKNQHVRDTGITAISAAGAAMPKELPNENVEGHPIKGNTGSLPDLADINEKNQHVRDTGIAAISAAGAAMPKELPVENVEKPPIKGSAASDIKPVQMATFALPKPAGKGKVPTMKLPKRLTYQYGYGSESDITYRRNPDLNRSVRDDSLVLTPEINGTLTYRPTDWLEMTLEMIFEREIPLQEEDRITLPDGEIVSAEDRDFSLQIDQAFVTIKDFTDPFKITLGRRNYEDERHWLYDTSMDIASLELKLGKLRTEALVGREVWHDMDLLTKENEDRIDTYILYTHYRGIEDIKLAGYAIFRDDRTGTEGQPLLLGLRSQGMRTETFSYWIEFAYMLGSDESSRDFRGYAFDVGGTYRFFGLPYNPNFTLAYAFASGDDNPNHSKSNEFRQTGLQSNEAQFAGVSEFNIYGEALDPELSNLMIVTSGLGFRPAPNVSLDFVYHYYRLDEFAEEIRNAEITALMNQVETRQSKDVGSAFDIVIGYRNLFGVRRLGTDIRVGWFFPGKAFLRDDSDEENPIFRDADKGASVVAKFWW